ERDVPIKEFNCAVVPCPGVDATAGRADARGPDASMAVPDASASDGETSDAPLVPDLGADAGAAPDGAPPPDAQAGQDGLTPDALPSPDVESLDAEASDGAFPYTPSNFRSFQIPEARVGDMEVLDCGRSTFDSTSLEFGAWCRPPAAMPLVLSQAGGT